MSVTYTERFTEVHEPVGVLYPATRQAGVTNTAWISLANHQRITFPIIVGTLGAGATVNFLVQEATDAAGANAQAIVGKAITEIDTADCIANIEVRTEELDHYTGQFSYVRGVLTIANAAAVVSVLPLRHCPNYPPVSVAGWAEVVD